MLGAPVEDDFLNRPGPMPRGRTGAVLLAIALLLGGFGWWAASFQIEEVARATGRVVPSSQLQRVQTLEGGIVRGIDVAEGQIVELGQPLVRIDDTGFAARLGELTRQADALAARAARLGAEVAGGTPSFDPDLATRAPGVVAAEQALFTRRRDQLAQETAILRRRLVQRQAELAEQRALEEKLTAVNAPLARELDLSEDLFARGALPEIELLRLRARLAEQRGDLAVTRASAARLAAAVDEARAEIGAAQSAFVLRAQEDLAEVETSLAVVRETLTSATDRVTRTTLRAPVRGTVNKLHVATLGSVLQPGADVAEIVPLDDGLVIEADVSPRDVAFIHPAAAASVKITAYDYLVYGALPATVERISADAFTDERGNTFFRVTLRTEGGYADAGGQALPIIPGMVATVDIQTGRKTVLAYLSQPLLRAQSEALRER